MTISELEKILAQLRVKHGDIDIKYQTFPSRCTWTPKPTIRNDRSSGNAYVLLNP